MSSAQRNLKDNLDLGLTNMRRNPYLVDYTEYKKARENGASRNRAEAAARRQVQVRSQAAGPGRFPEDRRAAGTVPCRAAAGRARRSEADARRLMAAKRRKQRYYRRLTLLTGIAATVICGVAIAVFLLGREKSSGSMDADMAAAGQQNGIFFDDLSDKKIQGISAADFGKHPTWTEDFLTPNEYSRPGEALEQVNNIFVHYTANQGTSAAQNRSYFEQLKDTHDTSASAHFIIGYEGEIIQCVPLDEIAYAVQTRNYDSVSIECCYLESDGSFTQETYDSLISLLRWLMDVYDLDPDDVLRHYDCGGKKCPLYYTDNPGEWEKLKREL